MLATTDEASDDPVLWIQELLDYNRQAGHTLNMHSSVGNHALVICSVCEKPSHIDANPHRISLSILYVYIYI